MRNLHKLYYKDYYAGVDFAALDSTRSKKAVFRANLDLTANVAEGDLISAQLGPGVSAFDLEVQYPGLITGVGIQHEASVEGEFKLGLHLDYTTGLPVIYGSSVKGVLRSYFASCYQGNADVQKLLDDIFEGIRYGSQCNKPIYERDIFYDAVIVAPNNAGKILASDSLAPHDKSPLKEPNPISFVKIASGVRIQFRFRLTDTVNSGTVILSAKEKEQIFKNILTTFGIGAKTNVGYGQLK